MRKKFVLLINTVYIVKQKIKLLELLDECYLFAVRLSATVIFLIIYSILSNVLNFCNFLCSLYIITYETHIPTNTP